MRLEARYLPGCLRMDEPRGLVYGEMRKCGRVCISRSRPVAACKASSGASNATLKVPMSHELPKAYDPSVIEERWAEYWVREHLFDVATPEGTDETTKKFTMLLPPPNVTGRLHMGHMLNQTEMDILTRWHRMLRRDLRCGFRGRTTRVLRRR